MRAAVALLALTACASPVPVIFDTDMDSDCDDVGALAILHVLADQGEARILATMTSSQNPETPPCIDAINTWYGRPDLPIGAPKGKGAARKSKYAAGIAKAFPHDLTAAGDAAAMYREILQREPDRSVVIVTVGYLTNLADLLRLPDGPDLVRRKVRLWVCMGGNFVGKPARDDVRLSNNNFTVEKDGAHVAVWNWPGPIMFVGREIGSVPSGLKAGARLKELPEHHPVRLGYQLYFGGEPKDRHVADQTAVLFAVRGLSDYWDAETRGYMDLKQDMTFDWRYDKDPGQGYLLKRPGTDRRIEREIEDLMMRGRR